MKSYRLEKALVSFILVAAAFPAFAQTYKVSAKIVQGGTVIGEPTVVVREGVPASVSVSGEAGFKLGLVVKGDAAGTLEVAAQLDTRRGSVRCSVTAKPGEPALVSSGGLDLTLTVSPPSS